MKKITNRQLVIKITFILFVGSIVAGLFFSFYIKSLALNNLALKDAEKTSALIFEVMNTKMQEGWAKEDLAKIMKRLNTTKDGLEINSYQSEKITELFGEDIATKQMLNSNAALREVMQNGEKKLIVGSDNSIRFYYPMKTTAQCIACHTNTEVGDVNGVLDIYFPADEISIPLYMMISYFILFLVVFLIIIFIVFYVVLNKKIVSPLVNFTSQMKSIIKNEDLKKTIVIESNIVEISELGKEFNNLQKQIKYYYDELISQFHIDQMTALPNLLALKQDIQKNKNPNLVIFNINQFRNINSFYGYETGDSILIEFSKLLKVYGTESEKFYRISGDEFAWLKSSMINLYDLLEMLEELSEHAFIYKGSEIHLSLSCGIAESKERLIENANAALYQAKLTSKPLEIYDASMQEYEQIDKNIYWTQQLREALKEDRIITYYQPILDVNLQKANKFETLVRLQGKDGTIYSPIHFMEVAKLSRLYLRLTRVILKKSFRYFRDKPYSFSVNITIDDIMDIATRNYIIDLLKSFPEPSRVVYEILETDEIKEFEIINKFAQEVHEYGAKLAIDDFGSGYSNYDYVIKLNVDFLKIDSSLVMNVDKDAKIEIVVESIINVSRKLGLKTIAEYVHSKEVMDKVKELGIDFVQGYYINEPLANVELHTKDTSSIF